MPRPKGVKEAKPRKPGAGRVLKFAGPTKTIAFRVPISAADQITEAVNSMLEALATKNNNTENQHFT